MSFVFDLILSSLFVSSVTNFVVPSVYDGVVSSLNEPDVPVGSFVVRSVVVFCPFFISDLSVCSVSDLSVCSVSDPLVCSVNSVSDLTVSSGDDHVPTSLSIVFMSCFLNNTLPSAGDLGLSAKGNPFIVLLENLVVNLACDTVVLGMRDPPCLFLFT